MSDTRVDEIADGIYRIATYLTPPGMTFSEFLIAGDEPMLFHAGHRARFADLREAVARVLPAERLRWISFSHLEADESGAMNEWLSAAPQAEVVHGRLGARVSLSDLADRPPRALDDGETLDLGGKRVRWIATPHVPHGWDAGMLFEETTQTLFCSDLLAQRGDVPPTVDDGDLVGPALTMEDAMHATALTPTTAPTIRRLASLGARQLALMHGPTFRGAVRETLNTLADGFEERLRRSA